MIPPQARETDEPTLAGSESLTIGQDPPSGGDGQGATFSTRMPGPGDGPMTLAGDETEAATPSSTPRVPGADRTGYQYGDYKIRRFLARGGMGDVYEAVHVRLQQPVALKLLRAGAFASADHIQRFLIEARAVAKLHQHPNIIKIYNISEGDAAEGEQFFAMQLVRGGSLRNRLSEFGEDPRRAAALMIQVAGAVAYAHRKGILHRDLKPENILVDAQGNPYVTDFGLARRVDAGPALTPPPGMIPPTADPDAPAHETQGAKHSLTVPLQGLESSEYEGMIFGTPSYMPPEQAQGRLKDVSTLSDVYSLGATLYAVLAGRPPFEAGKVREVLDMVIRERPAPLRTRNPKVDRDLDAICMKCLAKDPAGRYESAEAFARDLNRWLDHEPVHARHTPWYERAGKWARREPRRASVAAFGGLSLVLVGSVAAAWYRSELETERNRIKVERDRIAAEAEASKNEVRALRAEKRQRQANLVIRDAGETIRGLVEWFESEQDNARAIAPLLKAVAFFDTMINQWADDDENRPAFAEACNTFARTARSLGEVDRVGKAYRRAIDALSAELKSLPDSPSSSEDRTRALAALAENHHDLGIFLSETGSLDAARAEYDEGRTIREGLCRCDSCNGFTCGHAGRTVDQIELGRSFGYLGDLHRVAGRIADARSAYENSHKLREMLFKKVGADRALRPKVALQLSRSFGNLAWLGRHAGDLDEAIARQTRSIDVLREPIGELKLGKASSSDQLELLEDYASGYRQLAEFQLEAGRGDEALASLKRSFEEFDRLCGYKPGNQKFAVGKGRAGAIHATTLVAMNRLPEARASADAALKLLDDNPTLAGNATYRLAQGQLLDALGRVELAQGHPEAAEARFRKALEPLDTLIRDGLKKNYDHTSEHARTLADLARALSSRGPSPESRDLADKAVREHLAAQAVAPEVKLIHQRLREAQGL